MQTVEQVWPTGDHVRWENGRVADVVNFDRGLARVVPAPVVGPEILAGHVYGGKSQRVWARDVKRKVLSINGDVVRFRHVGGHVGVMPLSKFAAWARYEVTQNVDD